MRNLFIVAGVAAMLAAGGCGDQPAGVTPAGAPTPVQAVDEVMLITSPAAISADGTARPDSFTAGVWFFSNSRGAKLPPTLVRGRVEILMYDGALSANALRTATPLHVWEFPDDQLPQYVGKHRYYGWGYNFLLSWGNDVPTQDRITVIVRFTGGGRTIESKPSTVTVRDLK